MDVFKSLKTLTKLEDVTIDNSVFRLHYKVTVVFLLSCAVLVTSKQFFGEPIQCQPSGDSISKSVAESYCWIFGTYTLRETLADENGVPGLGPHSFNHTDATRITHEYYQWICLIYYLLALCFYLPRYVWKNCEGGRLKFLVNSLREPLISSKWNNALKDKMANYIVKSKCIHRSYALRYIVCEILNFANVVLQFFILDWFFSGQFSLYGISFIKWTQGYEEINPMAEMFPKRGKCTYYNYGASGSIQNTDLLCILSLNILNEKLFLIIWFWLLILAAISLISLLYRFFIYSSRLSRAYLIRSQVKDLRKELALIIAHDLSYGDFFMLHQLGKNLNPIIFQELIEAICQKLNLIKSSKIYHSFSAEAISTI